MAWRRRRRGRGAPGPSRRSRRDAIEALSGGGLPRVSPRLFSAFATYGRWYLRRHFHAVRRLGAPPRGRRVRAGRLQQPSFLVGPDAGDPPRGDAVSRPYPLRADGCGALHDTAFSGGSASSAWSPARWAARCASCAPPRRCWRCGTPRCGSRRRAGSPIRASARCAFARVSPTSRRGWRGWAIGGCRVRPPGAGVSVLERAGAGGPGVVRRTDRGVAGAPVRTTGTGCWRQGWKRCRTARTGGDGTQGSGVREPGAGAGGGRGAVRLVAAGKAWLRGVRSAGHRPVVTLRGDR